MNHISISQKVELIKEHKQLLVDLLENQIKENEGYIYRYGKDNSELQEKYYNKILSLREIQAIINNF
tara:strand:- start:1430 stop:1630 length:201 start_codon:yes stop_codon:yes gene_type:complete